MDRIKRPSVFRCHGGCLETVGRYIGQSTAVDTGLDSADVLRSASVDWIIILSGVADSRSFSVQVYSNIIQNNDKDTLSNQCLLTNVDLYVETNFVNVRSEIFMLMWMLNLTYS